MFELSISPHREEIEFKEEEEAAAEIQNPGKAAVTMLKPKLRNRKKKQREDDPDQTIEVESSNLVSKVVNSITAQNSTAQQA